MDQVIRTKPSREPWNKGKLVGQKAPFKLKDIWAIRIRLQMYDRLRDLALFDLAIDSKLRASDLVKVRVRDVSHGKRVAARAIVIQQKTHHPVQFELRKGQLRLSTLTPSDLIIRYGAHTQAPRNPAWMLDLWPMPSSIHNWRGSTEWIVGKPRPYWSLQHIGLIALSFRVAYFLSVRSK